MGRIYIRKTNRGCDGGAYSTESLQLAINDVKNGNSTMKGAARLYGIPVTTLKHHVRGTRGKGIVSNAGCGGGGKLSIPEEAERHLAECLRTMEKWGSGLSRDEVLDLVQIYVIKNNIKTRFKNSRPGPEWFFGFKNRHRLSIKKPQSVEYSRMDQINPFIMYGFFNLLEEKIEELKLNGHPERIYNCDETSFAHDPSKTKVVGARNTPSRRTISSAGRENTTVLVCCSASGIKIPLLCVFKGKSIMESWIDENTHNATAYSATEKGWMDSTLFKNWFQKVFLKNIPKERPVLLVYDGHLSHVSTELIVLAKENNVTIVKLPPHTTHILQPLDVGVFKSMKTKWDQCLTKWQRLNPRRKIPKCDFVKTLNEVYEVMPENNIMNAFEKTGIYDPEKNGPNREAIDISIFKTNDLKRYNDMQKRKQSAMRRTLEDETELSEKSIYPDLSSVSCSSNQNQKSLEKEPSTSLQIQQSEDNEPSAFLRNQQSGGKAPSTSCEHTEIPEPEVSVSQTESQNQQIPQQTFEELILKLLKPNHSDAVHHVKTRKWICTVAEIITSDEYLQKKLENDEAKRVKQIKKGNKFKTDPQMKKKKQGLIEGKKIENKNVVKKLLNGKSSSESEDSLSETDLCQDTSSEWEKELDNECEGEFDNKEDGFSLSKNFSNGDFVLVQMTTDSGSHAKYPAQIISPPNSQDIEVSFLRQFRKHNDIFVFPDVPDKSIVYPQEILGKLDKVTKMRRGQLKFS